jgi:C1q domain
MNRFNNKPCIPTQCFPIAEARFIPQSAFRAVNDSFEQRITADTPLIPVQYPNEVFDLNNEYDPITSTFTPKQNGIYSIIASVNFGPDVIVNYRVLVMILVNGTPVVGDNDFFGEIPIGDATSVSAILQLAAGDEVNVATVSSTDGVLFVNPPAMHFQASIFPFSGIPSPSMAAVNTASRSDVFNNGTL